MTNPLMDTNDCADVSRCDECDRTIWCDEVHADGYVFCSTECRDADEARREWLAMSPSQQREAMGGPNGGDGDDD